MQTDDDGNLHAISYGACSTIPAQSHYSADDLEACALVYALKAIEEIAIHKRVTVITDNSHLLHLNTWHPINARQRRMLAYLMQFNLSIRYIRGSRNMLADALSRIFQDASKQERKDFEPKYMHEIDDFILPVTTRSVTRTALERIDKTADNNNMPITSGGDTTLQPQTVVDDPQPTATTVNGQLNNTATAENNDDKPVILPSISADDYDMDDEFGHIYRHLQTNELTGDDRKDKTTLLLRDKFMIENNLLYRIDLPRQKRLARLKPVIKRLCVPKCFRHEIIRYVHDNCGHYAVQNLFHTLAARYFWKSLFADATEYCETCARQG